MTHQHGQQLIDYYETRYQVFVEQLALLSARHSAENVHQLRVAIKKLRAILTLIERLPPTIHVDSYCGHLKPVFDAAGKLREIQLNHQLMQHYCKGMKSCRRRYLLRADKARHRLLTRLGQLDTDGLQLCHEGIRTAMLTIDDAAAISEANALIRHRLRKISKLARHVDDNHKLHRIRINLRIINETLKLLNAIGGVNATTVDIKQTKAAADAIGDWHDYGVAIEALGKYHEFDECKVRQDCLSALGKASAAQRRQATRHVTEVVNLLPGTQE